MVKVACLINLCWLWQEEKLPDILGKNTYVLSQNSCVVLCCVVLCCVVLCCVVSLYGGKIDR